MKSETRKEFIIKATLAGATLTSGLKAFSKALEDAAYNDLSPVASDSQATQKISIFSKNLQWLDYKAMADAAARMGFDGVDLTVRSKGHVLPQRVEEDLPKAVEAVRKAGLNIYMLTTEIVNAEDPFTERILKTAQQLGIGYYRMGWFKYLGDISISKNLESFKSAMTKLEKLNKKYNIHGAYQNHAGAGFGAAVWDLWMVIKDLDPRWIGCQYDVRHATVEGANSWLLGLELVHQHIRTINLKDFQWTLKDNKWEEENVPLGNGMVNFKKYLELLKSYRNNPLISVHYEYPLGGAESGADKLTINKELVIEAMQKDLITLKKWL
jgi:sugar phosphate isomerase/epimerase